MTKYNQLKNHLICGGGVLLTPPLSSYLSSIFMHKLLHIKVELNVKCAKKDVKMFRKYSEQFKAHFISECCVCYTVRPHKC